IRLERRSGDRREQQRPVPQCEIAGKEEARPEEPAVPQRGRPPRERGVSRSRFQRSPQREERQSERATPERRRRRTGLGQAYEYSRARDSQGAAEEGDERQRAAEGGLRERTGLD